MKVLSSLHTDIRQILEHARNRTRSAINSAMVEAYWLIGKRIVEEEQQGENRAQYGKRTLETLTAELSQEFGTGFSYANLRNFRQFYLTYPDQQICYTLCSKLSWSHNRLIMRVNDPAARDYYLQACASEQWSVRQLERSVKTHDYRRLLSSQSDKLSQPQDQEPADSELARGFSFVARQMRISTETSHFYLDLVFYNYLLKCFVIIDLKTGKLSHQDIGQMDMYVRMFDDLKRGKDDNPTIGIILCEDKDETIVRYSVLQENQQLFASKYQRILPTEAELSAELERERRLFEEKNNEL